MPDVVETQHHIEVRQFDEDGFRGPLRLIERTAMASLVNEIEQTVLTTDPDQPANGNRLMSRHQDSAAIRRIASAPAVLAALRPLLGDDIVFWNSYLWLKEPGGLEIPWHQDIDYWPLEPWLTVSVWLALDAVDEANSCPRLIPGSHRRVLPSVAVSGAAFDKQADPTTFDASQAVAMVMDPGEGFLFNERCLHQSHPNRSDRRRLGLSLRYCTPMVRIAHDQPPLFRGHAAMLVSGRDRFGYNRYLD